ncbi:hypothetical protein TNCV_3827411 [Trichonephila clavipes]|nr:hypothetical protein TNCV_3827411 [Trichonephila clavipes]
MKGNTRNRWRDGPVCPAVDKELWRLGPDGSELATRVKQDASSSWKQTPVHEWYEGNHSGAALLGTNNRRDKNNLARGVSQWTYSSSTACGGGLKVYPSCSNYNVTQVASAHILACFGCHNSQLLSSPATVLQCVKTHGFMNLIFHVFVI